MKVNEDYPTIRQAATMNILSETALRAMYRRGELPGFFVGNHFHINRRLLLEQLDAQSRANTENMAAPLREAR